MRKVFNVTLAVEAETDKEIQSLTDLPIDFKVECDEAKVRVLKLGKHYKERIYREYLGIEPPDGYDTDTLR